MSDNRLTFEINAFIVDRLARRLSPRTIQFYQDELRYFFTWVGDIIPVDCTPDTLRRYLVHLQSTRNPGGQHAAYRVLRAFYNWLWLELSPDKPNPIIRVPSPRLTTEPLPGIPLPDIQAMLSTCNRSMWGLRDRAIILTLLDTGLRKTELTALLVGDIDIKSGAVQVHKGKGGKSRVVYLGATVRRELLRYLRRRPLYTERSPAWVARGGQPLSPSGLREIIRRRATAAGVSCPGLHDFRRTFAIECLRAGMSVFVLMRLMGHTSPIVLNRYLALVQSDLKASHDIASPADRL